MYSFHSFIISFSASNIIFPSKKIFNIIKEIDDNILPLYIPAPFYNKKILINTSEEREDTNKFNTVLDKIENSINKINQRVKIKETDFGSYSERFTGITAFYFEAYRLKEEDNLIPLEKRFINLAIKMQNLGVYPEES